MTTTEIPDEISPNGQLLRSTTTTARVCDHAEMDVAIYGRTVISVHDDQGWELFRMELEPGSWVKAIAARDAT